jgi:hypothetical protein
MSTDWNLTPFIPQRRPGLAKCHWYQNQFSLNLPSTVALSDETPSFNASIKELTEFGQHTLKNGEVLIDLQSVFDTVPHSPMSKSNQ